MTVRDFLVAYGSPVAWIIAALGWWVANKSANLREERKEIRAEIEDACSVVSSILDAFGNYRQTGAGTVEAIHIELEIKIAFQELNLRLDRLRRRRNALSESRLDLHNLDDLSIQFFDAVTGGDFEASDRSSSVGDKQLVARVVTKGLALNDALHRAFLRAFCGDKPASPVGR